MGDSIFQSVQKSKQSGQSFLESDGSPSTALHTSPGFSPAKDQTGCQSRTGGDNTYGNQPRCNQSSAAGASRHISAWIAGACRARYDAASVLPDKISSASPACTPSRKLSSAHSLISVTWWARCPQKEFQAKAVFKPGQPPARSL